MDSYSIFDFFFFALHFFVRSSKIIGFFLMISDIVIFNSREESKFFTCFRFHFFSLANIEIDFSFQFSGRCFSRSNTEIISLCSFLAWCSSTWKWKWMTKKKSEPKILSFMHERNEYCQWHNISENSFQCDFNWHSTLVSWVTTKMFIALHSFLGCQFKRG